MTHLAIMPALGWEARRTVKRKSADGNGEWTDVVRSVVIGWALVKEGRRTRVHALVVLENGKVIEPPRGWTVHYVGLPGERR